MIDISIQRLEDEEVVDVHGTLRKIRDQRPLSIGMPSQYTYCHRALIEYALSRGLLNVDFTLEDLDDNEQLDIAYKVKVNEYIANAKSKLSPNTSSL